MLNAVNRGLREYAPGLHRALKSGAECIGLPLPKMLYGRPVLAHFRLWNRVVWGDHVLDWISEHLHRGNVFFDVGAHHGWMSMVAARRTGRIGKVVAFEPSPQSVEYLRYHKRMNRIAQMEIVPMAVSNVDATVPFVLVGDGDAVMNSLVELEEIKNDPRGSSVISVKAITLDSYARETGQVPSMIKIDVEGAEVWACEGARELLAQRRPVLIVATHPAWLPEGQKIEDLFAMLAGFGYRVAAQETMRYRNTDFGDYLFVADEPTTLRFRESPA